MHRFRSTVKLECIISVETIGTQRTYSIYTKDIREHQGNCQSCGQLTSGDFGIPSDWCIGGHIESLWLDVQRPTPSSISCDENHAGDESDRNATNGIGTVSIVCMRI